MGVSFLLFTMSDDAPLSSNSLTIFSARKIRFEKLNGAQMVLIHLATFLSSFATRAPVPPRGLDFSRRGRGGGKLEKTPQRTREINYGKLTRDITPELVSVVRGTTVMLLPLQRDPPR